MNNNQAIKDLTQVMHLKKMHYQYIRAELNKVGIVEKDVELEELENKIRNSSSIFKNQDLSVLYYKTRSIACQHCNMDQGCTIRLTQKCNRDCFFCFVIEDFNNNCKPDIERFINEIHQKQQEINIRSIAISGGEPFLYKDDLFSLLTYIRTNLDKIYLRIYSNGDYLTEDDMIKLNSLNIDEIRLSVKPGNIVDRDKIGLVCKYVPSVIIEVPVIPDDADWMYNLIDIFEGIGISGINLVEFFYNGFRAEEFKKRNLKIFLDNGQIRNINDTMPRLEYPVFGSKTLAYKLLLRATEHNTSFFINICSNKTKNLQYIEKNKRYRNKFIKTFFRIYDYKNDSYVDTYEMPKNISDHIAFKLELDENLNLLTDLEIVFVDDDEVSISKLLKDYSTGSYLLEGIV